MDLAHLEAVDVADARLVRITGEIDMSNAAALMELIGESVPSDAAVVVVDLGALTFLDSSGISMLFRLAERLRYRRQELRVVAPTGTHVRRVLELTRVDDVIPVLESVET